MIRSRQYRVVVVAIAAIAFGAYLDIASVPATTSSQTEQAALYLTEKNLPTPTHPFRHDGCTIWPDTLWGHDLRAACLTHDIAYWAGGSERLRDHADIEFYRELRHTGLLGPFPIAHIMYARTFAFGNSWLSHSLGTNWGYGWNE